MYLLPGLTLPSENYPTGMGAQIIAGWLTTSARVPIYKLQHLHIHLPASLFLTSLLEYNCFTLLCQLLLYNKVNQLYVYIYLHIPSLLSLPPTLPILPLQVVIKHLADLPVLCGCFPLAIYFTFGSAYMSTLLSPFIPGYPSPSPCPQVPSLRLHLYSSPAPRFFSKFFFLDSIYMCQHMVFVFLFLTSLCMTDSRSIHLTTNNSISSLFMAE